MTNEKPDWIRLHKALAIEAEHGFTDLVGRQYRFSEFLSLTLGKFPTGLPQTERRRWQGLAVQFASYPHLALEERQHLVAETRRYLSQLQQEEQGEQGEQGK
ncbi:DNA helicase RecG, partial [Nostoc sp. NZL]|nr:DNA helicase RecG [Nostoc sp. NZL]